MNGIAADIAAVSRIEIVPRILEIVCRTTGMRFAAVARVTTDRWVACGVHDDIQFGLEPGGELKLETTICNEIRASGERVVIDHVAAHATFCRHPTPALYGFQSYISVPIRRSGEFFGTLCAIDPLPARLNTPEVIGMFEVFADVIALYLDLQQRTATNEAAPLAEIRERVADIQTDVAALQNLDANAPTRAAILGRLRESATLLARLLSGAGDRRASV